MRFVLLLLLGMLPSCVLGPRPMKVTIDAMAAPGGSDERVYWLVPGNEDLTQEDLQFQEFATYLQRALKAKGFELASNQDSAKVTLVLSYGVTELPATEVPSSQFGWNQTGFFPAYFPYSHSYAYGYGYGRYGFDCLGSPNYYPYYGGSSFLSVTQSRPNYLQQIHIAALQIRTSAESKSTSDPAELWRITISSKGRSGDLRRGFPLMLAAALPYLAADSGQQIELKITEEDESLLLLKGN